MFTLVGWAFLASTVILTEAQNNPSILEDSRVHPTSDGSFGFLYRTQDGIAHAAKGDPGGAVHGRFTYTDPTGLKVNFNYNAGAQAIKQKQQEALSPQPIPQPQYIQKSERPQEYRPVEDNQRRYTQVRYDNEYEQPAYEQPARRQQAPVPESSWQQPQYRPQRPPVQNDIYDNDYNSRFNRP